MTGCKAFQDVINGKISTRDFTSQLQSVLQSVAQPNLEPFLQQTLPMMRLAIQNNEVRRLAFFLAKCIDDAGATRRCECARGL